MYMCFEKGLLKHFFLVPDSGVKIQPVGLGNLLTVTVRAQPNPTKAQSVQVQPRQCEHTHTHTHSQR